MISSLPRGPRSTFVYEKNASKKKRIWKKKKIASPTTTTTTLLYKKVRARHVWLLLFSSKKVAPFVGRSKRSLFSESALMMMRFFVSLCCKVLVLVFGGILV